MSETMEYPSRVKAVGALARLHKNEDVALVELIGNGRTLRVTWKDGQAPVDEDGPALEGLEGVQEPSTEDTGPVAPPEGDEAPQGSEEEPPHAPPTEGGDEDLLGEPPAEDPDVDGMDRQELRDLIEAKGLDIEVSVRGPLDPIREKVKAALSGD